MTPIRHGLRQQFLSQKSKANNWKDVEKKEDDVRVSESKIEKAWSESVVSLDHKSSDWSCTDRMGWEVQ